jgi:tRNA U55 pseudouridine synthase TruB
VLCLRQSQTLNSPGHCRYGVLHIDKAVGQSAYETAALVKKAIGADYKTSQPGSIPDRASGSLVILLGKGRTLIDLEKSSGECSPHEILERG